jgi:hypothetical protein
MEEAEAKLKKAEAERQRARAAAEAEAERLRKEAEADAAVWSLQPSSWTLEPTTFPAKRDALVENVYPRLLHIQGAKQPHISITHVRHTHPARNTHTMKMTQHDTTRHDTHSNI